MNINTTINYADLSRMEVAPTARDLRRWVWGWLLAGNALGVNGVVKRRWYVRKHKLWEYARGMAYTGVSRPARSNGTSLSILDVGGAMTLPVFYLAGLGDKVVSLDIDRTLAEQTNAVAGRYSFPVDARTTNLVEEDPKPADLGAPGGFDRVYSFCVIEHIPSPGQARVASRMAGLLKPGGLMCLTFDFGEHAPTAEPLRTAAHVQAIRDAVGLPLTGGGEFVDNGKRYRLDRKHPGKPYTFGSLFFRKPT